MDTFHGDFLVPSGIEAAEPPAEYAIYAPGAYAVFFLDPAGIRWELVRFPLLPTLPQLRRFEALRQGHVAQAPRPPLNPEPEPPQTTVEKAAK